MAKDLLLEIGLEEMPARFVTESMNQLADKMKKWLEEKKITYCELKSYSTPRRLTILVTDVNESQADIHEEAKGPAKKIAKNENNEWSKAAVGFSRGQGMTVDDIYFKEVNGVEYAHIQKFIKGKQTIELLHDLKEIILGLTFPKNMRWANEDLRYIRPIKWIMALFGQEVIPFSITNVESGNETFGHRFLGGKIQFNDSINYESKMLEQFVVVDPEKRKNTIISQLKEIEAEKGWVIPVDEDLLEEVNNLVEYPTAFYGTFEKEFLDLPEEVLITSMKEHQRYFPVKTKDGTLLPYFIAVRNGSSKNIDNVARGNEKVLRARLSDASFFYREDKKVEIEQSLAKLKSIVYHEEIGTLFEKVSRVRQLTNILSEKLSFSADQKQASDRAAEICKFDLVTNMVNEFPELQGLMGEKYARQKGEKEQVAIAINEHYMPRNAEDETPNSDIGAVLAISEKMDTIVSFISIGLIPSGSQDPYALRRQATGIAQILINKGWKIELEDIINESLNLLESVGVLKGNKQDIFFELVSFFKLRVKHLLQEIGISYDIIDAVLGGKLGVLSSLIKRAKVLEANKSDIDFKGNIETLSRVLSIANKAEKRSDIQIDLFENEYETKLYKKYLSITEALNSDISEDEYFQYLLSMKDEINQYFDHTMVMADNLLIRQNRLNQMVRIADLIKQFANVNEILVK